MQVGGTFEIISLRNSFMAVAFPFNSFVSSPTTIHLRFLTSVTLLQPIAISQTHCRMQFACVLRYSFVSQMPTVTEYSTSGVYLLYHLQPLPTAIQVCQNSTLNSPPSPEYTWVNNLGFWYVSF